MKPGHACKMLGFQLINRKAKARMRGAWVIARHLPFGVLRIDAQADVKAATCDVQDRAEAINLPGRIEDHMV